MEIIAHRGASHDAPENTLAAICLAWRQNSGAVEIDVHLSQDGAIVAVHDANTLRTTGHDTKIAAQTLEELKRLNARSWKNARFTDETISTLDEVLAEFPQRKGLAIEVKDTRPEIVPALQDALEQSEVLAEQLLLTGIPMGAELLFHVSCNGSWTAKHPVAQPA